MLTLLLLLNNVLSAQSVKPSEPRFEDFPVAEVFEGTPADPILITAEQRLYRTRIRRGVSKGEGVWYGSWRKPIQTKRPNFAGHYYVIRWGCASNCVMAAIVGAKTGKVFGPPMSDAKTGFYVNFDPLGDYDIDIHPQSSLMVLRNACAVARSGCGVYYFNWENDRFQLVKKVLVDLMKSLQNPGY